MLPQRLSLTVGLLTLYKKSRSATLLRARLNWSL